VFPPLELWVQAGRQRGDRGLLQKGQELVPHGVPEVGQGAEGVARAEIEAKRALAEKVRALGNSKDFGQGDGLRGGGEGNSSAASAGGVEDAGPHKQGNEFGQVGLGDAFLGGEFVDRNGAAPELGQAHEGLDRVLAGKGEPHGFWILRPFYRRYFTGSLRTCQGKAGQDPEYSKKNVGSCKLPSGLRPTRAPGRPARAKLSPITRRDRLTVAPFRA